MQPPFCAKLFYRYNNPKLSPSPSGIGGADIIQGRVLPGQIVSIVEDLTKWGNWCFRRYSVNLVFMAMKSGNITTESILTGREAMALEDRYGAHNYHPLPVVLTRGEGVFV